MGKGLFLAATMVVVFSGTGCGKAVDSQGTPNTGGTAGGPVDSGRTATGGNGGQGSGGATCGSTNDTGGRAALGTIADAVPGFKMFTVRVNRSDGFSTPNRSDWWTVNVADATVTLNSGSPVQASTSQVQALATALSSSAYRDRPPCCTYQFIDGSPNAPVIDIGIDNADQFGVGDCPCWLSANAYSGSVISCADFAVIFNLLEAIAPSGTPFRCYDYF